MEDAGNTCSNDNTEFYNPRHRFSEAFKYARFQAPEEIWNLFTEAEDCCDIIDYFNALVKALNIDPAVHGLEFYDILKSKLTSWKCQALWDLLNSRMKHSEYKMGKAAKDKKCIIIGAGPIGLRMAIEALLLGCSTVVVEKRDTFTRNNVLHLWPFLMTDFRNLGAKKFYGKFGAGCIEHINIRTLQCILLKVALILGAEVYVGVVFKHLVEPTDEESGWKGVYEPENHVLSKFKFDIIIGADGKKNVLPGFNQIELRGALAIGITCNFVNKNSLEEAKVNEISGISYQYNQDFFHKMDELHGVRLENIVYYKDETHYFVMTALKSSLLKFGVLNTDFPDPKDLLHNSNVDQNKLLEFALSAVNYSTNNELPKDLEWKILSNGEPDIALFDFTSIKKASSASRIIERNKQMLLLALIGDSLIEPFWPTGSGAGRGVLSALDTAWLIKQFCGPNPPLAVMRERENVYKLLSGTTNGSLQKNYKAFTIDPKTRYTAFDAKKVSNLTTLKSLYDTDNMEADFSVASPVQPTEPKRRRRSSSGGTSSKKKVTSTHIHPHGTTPSKKRSPFKEKPPSVGNTKKFWEEHNKKMFVDNMPKKKAPPSQSHEADDVELDNLDNDVFELSCEKKSPKSPKQNEGHTKEKSKKELRTTKRKKSRDQILTRQRSSENSGKGKKTKGAKDEKARKGSHKEADKARKDPKKEDMPRPIEPKGFFRKWIVKIGEKFNDNTMHDTEKTDKNETHGVVALCNQTAAFTVMLLPLALDCSNPPLCRTGDIKRRLTQQACAENSSDRKEVKEISRTSMGNVKDTIQKLKLKVEQDQASYDYYEFLKNKRGSVIIDSTDSVNTNSTDFTPKNLIYEQDICRDTSEQKTFQQVTKPKNTSDGESRAKKCLQMFCDRQTEKNRLLMLQVLYNIHKRIFDNPEVEKYYRIYIKGTIFEKLVWSLDGAEAYFNSLGWVKCGNYIVISRTYDIKTCIGVVDSMLRRYKTNARMNGGILSNGGKEKSINDTIVNTEMFESRKHMLGEEEYVVVDLINKPKDGEKSIHPTQVGEPDGNIRTQITIDGVTDSQVSKEQTVNSNGDRKISESQVTIKVRSNSMEITKLRENEDRTGSSTQTKNELDDKKANKFQTDNTPICPQSTESADKKMKESRENKKSLLRKKLSGGLRKHSQPTEDMNGKEFRIGDTGHANKLEHTKDNRVSNNTSQNGNLKNGSTSSEHQSSVGFQMPAYITDKDYDSSDISSVLQGILDRSSPIENKTGKKTKKRFRKRHSQKDSPGKNDSKISNGGEHINNINNSSNENTNPIEERTNKLEVKSEVRRNPVSSDDIPKSPSEKSPDQFDKHYNSKQVDSKHTDSHQVDFKPMDSKHSDPSPNKVKKKMRFLLPKSKKGKQSPFKSPVHKSEKS